MAQDLVIGIDIGGQTTKCGIVDARGTVLSQTVIRSDNFIVFSIYTFLVGVGTLIYWFTTAR